MRIGALRIAGVAAHAALSECRSVIVGNGGATRHRLLAPPRAAPPAPDGQLEVRGPSADVCRGRCWRRDSEAHVPLGAVRVHPCQGSFSPFDVPAVGARGIVPEPAAPPRCPAEGPSPARRCRDTRFHRTHREPHPPATQAAAAPTYGLPRCHRPMAGHPPTEGRLASTGPPWALAASVDPIKVGASHHNRSNADAHNGGREEKDREEEQERAAAVHGRRVMAPCRPCLTASVRSARRRRTWRLPRHSKAIAGRMPQPTVVRKVSWLVAVAPRLRLAASQASEVVPCATPPRRHHCFALCEWGGSSSGYARGEGQHGRNEHEPPDGRPMAPVSP